LINLNYCLQLAPWRRQGCRSSNAPHGRGIFALGDNCKQILSIWSLNLNALC